MRRCSGKTNPASTTTTVNGKHHDTDTRDCTRYRSSIGHPSMSMSMPDTSNELLTAVLQPVRPATICVAITSSPRSWISWCPPVSMNRKMLTCCLSRRNWRKIAVQLTQLNCILAHLLHQVLQKEKKSNSIWDLNPISENIFPDNENLFSIMGTNGLLLLLYNIEVD